MNRGYDAAPAPAGNPLEPAVATAELQLCPDCGHPNGQHGMKRSDPEVVRGGCFVPECPCVRFVVQAGDRD